jgi:probable HAF family extracellular repeat protein
MLLVEGFLSGVYSKTECRKDMSMKLTQLLGITLTAVCLACGPLVGAQTFYTVSDLGTLADNNGEVVGGASINLRGDVVGQEILPAGARRAFLWRNGKTLDLGTLGGLSAGARGISSLNFVAGTADRADDTEHAVLWRLSSALAPASVHAIDLGTFGGNSSEGNGINNFGSSVVFLEFPIFMP